MTKQFIATILCALLLGSLFAWTAAAEPLRIAIGSGGAEVREIQQRLRALDYYKKSVDGVFGIGTYLAVRGFQAGNGLRVDGVVGPQTMAKLRSNDARGRGSAAPAVITSGHSGDMVLSIQTRLQELGYYHGSLDGKFGQLSLQAVEAFQRNNGLYVDGKVGSGTYARLFADAAKGKSAGSSAAGNSVLRIKFGDKGAAVYQIQQRLTALHHFISTVDGSYGYRTYVAVRAFQESQGLKPDGVVGPLTWQALFP